MDRNIGTFDSIEELWAQFPQGGREGDTAIVGSMKRYWNKYSRTWILGDLSDASPKDNTPDISPFNGVGQYLGAFSSIVELWVRYPNGGMEYDYADVAGNRLFWNKYQNRWDDGVYDITEAVKTGTVDGNLHVSNNLTVGGVLAPNRLIMPEETKEYFSKLIIDARALAESNAKAYTDQLARKERLLGGALIDGKIDKSERALIDIIEEKVRLAKEYARLQDEKIRAAAIIHADGQVTTLEQAQLDLIEAQINLAKAKLEAYADGKIDEKEVEIIRRLEEQVREAERKLRELVETVEERTDEKIENAKTEIRQSWQGAIDTQDATIRAVEKKMGAAIKASSLNAIQVLVGEESGQFIFVSSMQSMEEVHPAFSYDGSTDTFVAPSCFLQHRTLGVTAIKSAMSYADYKTWQMKSVTFNLNQDSNYKYLYAKVSRTNTSGEFVLSNDPVSMESISGFYHLWVGVIVDYPSRYFQRMYGHTQILPGQVSAKRFMSSDGNFIIDTEEKKFVFRFTDSEGVQKLFAINRDGTGKIEIKGATVFLGDSDTSLDDLVNNSTVTLTLTPLGSWINGSPKDVSFAATLRRSEDIIDLQSSEIYFRYKYISKDAFTSFSDFEKASTFIFVPSNDLANYDGIIVECRSIYQGKYYYASARIDNNLGGDDRKSRIRQKILELIDMSIAELQKIDDQYAVWRDSNPEGEDDFGEGDHAWTLLKLLSNTYTSRTLNDLYNRYKEMSISLIHVLDFWLRVFDDIIAANGGSGYVDGQSQDYSELLRPKIMQLSSIGSFVNKLRQEKGNIADILSENAKDLDIDGGLFSYVTDVIKRGRTEVKGGLVLTNVLAVGDGDTVSSYISGDGSRPAFAAGVKNFGRENESRNVAINHDGTANYGMLNLSPSGEVFAEKGGRKYLQFGGKAPTIRELLRGEGDNSIGYGKTEKRTVGFGVISGGTLSESINVRNINADIKVAGTLYAIYNFDDAKGGSKGSSGSGIWIEVFLSRDGDPYYKVPLISASLPNAIVIKEVSLSVKAPASDRYYIDYSITGREKQEVVCGISFGGRISATHPGVGEYTSLAEDGIVSSRGRGKFFLFNEAGMFMGDETSFPGVLCSGSIDHNNGQIRYSCYGYFRDRLASVRILYNPDEKKYLVPHIIGHYEYTPLVTPTDKFVIARVSDILENYFSVELYDITTRQKTTGSFRFACFGRNYSI